MSLEDTHRYDDIIDLPHHRSCRHPHMPIRNRAAQFMPFAALTGYEDVLREVARRTAPRASLDEDEKTALDGRLRFALTHADEHPIVRLTYFKPDGRKEGGSYETISCVIRRLDDEARSIVTESGLRVPLDDVVRVSVP